MSSEIKLLVTSDLHLGMERSPISREIQLRTFQKIVSLAMECDLLLVAGDFIDADGCDDALIEAVNADLKRLKSEGIAIIYSPGVADGEQNRSLQALDAIDATWTFSGRESIDPYFFDQDGQKIIVYGAPATYDFSDPKSIRTDDEGFHLGLFHVNFNPELSVKSLPDSPVSTIGRDEIKIMGLDFFIFGYNHNFKMFKIQDKIIAAYPGSPEATSVDETGDRYVLTFSISNNEIHNFRRLAVNTILVDGLEIDCGSRNSFDSIISDILLRASKKTCLTVTLTGNRNFPIYPETLKKYSGEFYALRFSDSSLPTLEMFFNVYGYEESVRGEMLRIIREKMQNGNVPSGVSEECLTQIIKHLVSDNASALEDWLCTS